MLGSLDQVITALDLSNRAQELCESRGGRPGLPVPNSPYGFCGREATLKSNLNLDKGNYIIIFFFSFFFKIR